MLLYIKIKYYENMNNIKLSIILCSKNDKYCGDSVSRLIKCLNHTGDIFKKGDKLNEVEVILSDWGSKVPLEKYIENKLNTSIKKIIKYVYINKNKTTKIRSPFSEVHALNAAARLANGKFIGRIDQDTLIGENFIKWFFSNKPKDSNFYFSGRRDMNKQQSEKLQKGNSIDFILENKNGIKKWIEHEDKNSSLFYHEAVGIILIPTKIYKEIRGYNEVNIFYNHMEIEFIERLKKIINLINLGEIINYDFYHIFHELRLNSKNNLFPWTTRLPWKVRLKLKPNNKDWGKVKTSYLLIIKSLIKNKLNIIFELFYRILKK